MRNFLRILAFLVVFATGTSATGTYSYAKDTALASQGIQAPKSLKEFFQWQDNERRKAAGLTAKKVPGAKTKASKPQVKQQPSVKKAEKKALKVKKPVSQVAKMAEKKATLQETVKKPSVKPTPLSQKVKPAKVAPKGKTTTKVLQVQRPDFKAAVEFSKKKEIVAYDRGGVVIDFALKVAVARKYDTKIAFTGPCDSACTLRLALPKEQLCVSQGASFGFHKAFIDGTALSGSGSNKEASQIATRYLMKQYPRWVLSWINQNGGLSSDIKRMPYEYARQYLSACTSS